MENDQAICLGESTGPRSTIKERAGVGVVEEEDVVGGRSILRAHRRARSVDLEVARDDQILVCVQLTAVTRQMATVAPGAGAMNPAQDQRSIDQRRWRLVG